MNCFKKLMCFSGFLLCVGCVPKANTQRTGIAIAPSGPAKTECEKQKWLYLGKTRATIQTSEQTSHTGNYATYNVFRTTANGIGFYQHDSTLGFRLSHIELEHAFEQLDKKRLRDAHFAPIRGIRSRHRWSERMLWWWSSALAAVGLVGVFATLPFLNDEDNGSLSTDLLGVSTGLILSSSMTMLVGAVLRPNAKDMGKMRLQESVILRNDKRYLHKLIGAVNQHNKAVRHQCR